MTISKILEEHLLDLNRKLKGHQLLILNPELVGVTNLVKSHEKELAIKILEGVKLMAEAQELFILNVLNGVDVADAQMQNEGGGTKAIRQMLLSRVLLSSLLREQIKSIENDELVVRIPLTQPVNNPYEDTERLTDNLIGIIAGDEYTISQLNDLDYKGSQQEGMPIIYFDSREELEEACKIGGISIWEHPLCAYCHRAIRGSFYGTEKGYQCDSCRYEKKD